MINRSTKVPGNQFGDRREFFDLYYRDLLNVLDGNLLEAHAEEPVGFDHLETFVHQCGRIDCDSAAHFPIRVSQGLLGSDTI